MLRRTCLLLLVALSAAACDASAPLSIDAPAVTLATSLAATEILTETGTFDGIYHKNRWGNAGLRFLSFDGEIARRLDRYDGQRIRVTVTKGEQRMNPGPVHVHEIGDVEVLPECPVGMELSLVPEDPREGEPFQAVVTLVNRGEEPVVLGDSADDQVRLSLLSERASPVPSSPDGTGAEFPPGAEPSGYASAWGTLPGRSPRTGLQHTGWHMLDATSRARLGHGHVRLEPGASFPLVVSFSEGLSLGEHELSAFLLQRVGDAWLPSFAAMAFDVGPAAAVRRPAPLHASDVVVRRVDTWTHEVTMRVRAEPGTRVASDSAWNAAFLATGRAADGSRVPVAPANATGESWSLRSLSTDEQRVTLSVRHATEFPDVALARLELSLLTERGLVPVDVPVSIEDDVERVPFGPEHDGVRIRGIPRSPVQHEGQPRLHFRFQAENVRGTPGQWRMPAGCDGVGVTITIDGMPIDLRDRPPSYLGGWALHRLCDQPTVWNVAFDRPKGLVSGRHVLRLTIHSKAGSHRNTDGVAVPLLDGDLVSNDVAFVVD